MPIYDFRHNETGEEWNELMSWKDKDAYCKEHNCMQVILSAPTVVRGVGDLYSKTDNEFKDRMKEIKKAAGTKRPNTMDGW